MSTMVTETSSVLLTFRAKRVTPKYPRAFKNLSECGTMKCNKFQRTVTKYNLSLLQSETHGGKGKMNESSQAIVAVKREVQLSERQRQVQERQEQGIPVDEWCASLGISKGAYYHRLRKVREYMCQQMVETHPNWECDLRSGNNERNSRIPCNQEGSAVFLMLSLFYFYCLLDKG